MKPGPVAEGDEIVGRWRYRLVERIGEGASGWVYRARTLPGGPPDGPPETVAVKVLGGEHARTELSALRALSSPRVARVYDGALGPVPFLALHRYPGGTLRNRLAASGALDEPAAWFLLRQLLEALVAAHAASVLHLDVKPSNVLADGDGGWVLADFGVARPSRAHFASLGLGTVGYQAPEQRERLADRIDMRTDLYGAAATTWAAWTGVDLARASAAPLLERATATGGLAAPSEVRPGCSPAFDRVLGVLLATDPARRLGSAADALAFIDRLADPASIPPAVPGVAVSPEEADGIVENLVDPLWAAMFAPERRGIRRVEAGGTLCEQGDPSHHVFVLLRGRVQIERDGVVLAAEDREGMLMGEISALTGGRRTATLRALDTVWIRALNASQLEEVLVAEPAIALRLLRQMATRLSR
ncbi:MAG: protein kinase domain-containing protein [Myxococcota bacterium]